DERRLYHDLNKTEKVYSNDFFWVATRQLMTRWGVIEHAAIKCRRGAIEPGWRDKQKIKNTIFGEGRIAVEVMPSKTNVIDCGNMYHMWVLPEDMTLPF